MIFSLVVKVVIIRLTFYDLVLDEINVKSAFMQIYLIKEFIEEKISIMCVYVWVPCIIWKRIHMIWKRIFDNGTNNSYVAKDASMNYYTVLWFLITHFAILSVPNGPTKCLVLLRRLWGVCIVWPVNYAFARSIARLSPWQGNYSLMAKIPKTYTSVHILNYWMRRMNVHSLLLFFALQISRTMSSI